MTRVRRDVQPVITRSALAYGRALTQGAVKPSKLYYGWIMLPVAAVIAICSTPGQTAGISAFNPHFLDSLNLSATRLSGAYMVATFSASTLLTFVGVYIDRFGPRRLLMMIVAGLALGCCVLAGASGLVTLALGFFLVRLFGQGGMSLVSSHTLANWFDRRLGLAMGLSTIGFSLGIAWVQKLFNPLIATLGWRQAELVIAAGLLVIILPLAVLLYRNYPADVGQRLEGQEHDENGEARPMTGATLPMALRSPCYWGFACINAFWAAAGTALIFFSIEITADKGLGGGVASTWMLVFGGTISVLMLPVGWLADKVPVRAILFAAVACMAGGMALMRLADVPTVLYLAAVLLGMSQTGVMTSGGVFVPRFFGRLHMGKIRGSLGTVMSASSAGGPFLVGVLRDGFGGYEVALTVLAALAPVLVLAAWWVVPDLQVSTSALAGNPQPPMPVPPAASAAAGDAGTDPGEGQASR